MPDPVRTIDRDQRVGLYELVRNHLGSIEDFFVALERTRDFAKAERLGLEFAEDFRLLQDLGWHPDDERETFELTMPRQELSALLTRLQREARHVLRGTASERQAIEDAEATSERFRRGEKACEALLVGSGDAPS